MPEPKFTRSHGRAESKRKAEENLPAGPPTKTTATTKSKDAKRRPKATGARSKKTSFKQKHAAEFDSHFLQEECSRQVQAKQERRHGDGTASSPTQSTRVGSAIPLGSTSPLVVVPTPRNAIAAEKDTDQDDVMVAILSQATWDNKMTRMTVDNLAERAKCRTSGGHLFDVDYINQLLGRLDNAAINAERRSEVVSLLQTAFKQLLSTWSACVDHIGSLDSRIAAPRILSAETRRSPSPSITTTSNHLRLLGLDKSAQPADVRAACGSLSPSSNEQDFWSFRGDDEDHEVESDHTGTRFDDFSVLATENFSAGSSINCSLVPRGERAVNNKRIYGTVCPKAPFDVFARSVIAAWTAAPGPEDAPTKIREFAKPTWRGSVTLDQKDEWYKIYETRKDPFTDVTAMGTALLLSQDLLAKVVPDGRLAAAKLLCQQHQGKLGAIVSTTTTLAKTATPPRLLDAGAAGSAPVATNPVHQGEISKGFTGSFKNFPRMTHAACDTPEWQPCLVPSAAQKQNVYTCVFVVNTPEVRTPLVLTEDLVRAACVRAQMPGLRELWQESFNIFVASFNGWANADEARRRKRLLRFPVSSTTGSSSTKLYVSAESHWHEVNRVFVYDVDNPVKHTTVARHVFKALEGPLASCFRLFKQEYREHIGRQRRTRYLLRPFEAISPILVERFYIPLDAASGKGNVWGIFKPVNRHWKCPACRKQCQGGDASACESAVELYRRNSDAPS